MQKWTEQEDQRLKQLVETYGFICGANMFMSEFSEIGRTISACHNRYYKHLRDKTSETTTDIPAETAVNPTPDVPDTNPFKEDDEVKEEPVEKKENIFIRIIKWLFS